VDEAHSKPIALKRARSAYPDASLTERALSRNCRGRDAVILSFGADVETPEMRPDARATAR
jgi:hypothetical protein